MSKAPKTVPRNRKEIAPDLTMGSLDDGLVSAFASALRMPPEEYRERMVDFVPPVAIRRIGPDGE